MRRTPRAVVFDLDGTMVDNMKIHGEAFALFTQRHGLLEMTKERRAQLDGKRNRDILPVLFGRALGDDELRAFADEKESLYRELSEGRMTAVPGLHRLLDVLGDRRIPVAIATSAPEANVHHSLVALGLPHLLQRVVRSDQVPQGKPFPDVFLAAARITGAPPGDCLAFEDAPMGVAAAKAAGMTCFGIATTFDAAAFKAHGVAPDSVVRDYDEFLETNPFG